MVPVSGTEFNQLDRNDSNYVSSWSWKISRATFSLEFSLGTSSFVEARTYINVVSSDSESHRWERRQREAEVAGKSLAQVHTVYLT